jgi:hypothetical protein
MNGELHPPHLYTGNSLELVKYVASDGLRFLLPQEGQTLLSINTPRFG